MTIRFAVLVQGITTRVHTDGQYYGSAEIEAELRDTATPDYTDAVMSWARQVEANDAIGEDFIRTYVPQSPTGDVEMWVAMRAREVPPIWDQLRQPLTTKRVKVDPKHGKTTHGKPSTIIGDMNPRVADSALRTKALELLPDVEVPLGGNLKLHAAIALHKTFDDVPLADRPSLDQMVDAVLWAIAQRKDGE